MFPIGSEIPHDTNAFRSALAQGLAPLGLGLEAVHTTGNFPQFGELRLELSGARFHRGLRAGKPVAAREPLCFVRKLEISAHPAHVEKVPVEMDLHAEDVTLAAADASEGSGKVLTMESAGHGSLILKVSRKDLETALYTAGQEAAQTKGAEVQGVELRLQTESPRALGVNAVITAKAMFFSTSVRVSGCLVIDDELNASLRDLHCEGDGMIGKMVAGVLQPQFRQLEARRFALGGMIGGVKLQDVTISGGDALTIRATFQQAV